MRIPYVITMPLLLAVTVPAIADPALIPEELPPFISTPPEPVYTGPLAETGKWLHDKGIDIRLDYLNIYQNAPAYGYRSGSYGVVILDTIGHLTPDLRVRFAEAFNLQIFNVGGYVNAFIPAAFDKSKTDLARFTLEADFLDDRLRVEVGRMGLGRDFMVGGFCGGISCYNATMGASLNLPGDSLAVWGMQTAYKLTPDTSLGFAIIEDNPGNWQSGEGWDWSQGDAEGFITVADIHHEETFLNSAHPLKYEVGFYYRDTPYTDALYNSGWGNPTFGANTRIVTHEGNPAFYSHLRKVVWSNPTDAMIPENLAVVGGLYHTFGEGQAYPWEAYAGVEYSGFLPQNPLTTIGAAVHYIRLSEERAQYERNARLFYSGIDEEQPQNMFMFDFHTSTEVFHNGVFNVGAAYVINPNTSILADFSTGRRKDGFIFYASLGFDLSGALGLSPRRTP
mgnify:CR=1 FL=1